MVINVCECRWRCCWSCCGAVTSGSQAWRPPLHSCAARARLEVRCHSPASFVREETSQHRLRLPELCGRPHLCVLLRFLGGGGAGEGVSRGARPAAPAALRHQELAPGAGSRPPMVCCSGCIILGVEFFQITYSSGLNSVPLTFMLTRNSRMQPYLEMTSLQVSPS